MVSDDSPQQYKTSPVLRARRDYFSSLQTSYDDGWDVEGQFVHTGSAEPSRSGNVFKVSSALVAIISFIKGVCSLQNTDELSDTLDHFSDLLPGNNINFTAALQYCSFVSVLFWLTMVD